jgi:hypothetical protein
MPARLEHRPYQCDMAAQPAHAKPGAYVVRSDMGRPVVGLDAGSRPASADIRAARHFERDLPALTTSRQAGALSVATADERWRSYVCPRNESNLAIRGTIEPHRLPKDSPFGGEEV